MVSGESIVHCRCVAGGLGGLRLIFNSANEKGGQLRRFMFFIQTGFLIGVKCSARNPCNAPTMYNTFAGYHSTSLWHLRTFTDTKLNECRVPLIYFRCYAPNTSKLILSFVVPKIRCPELIRIITVLVQQPQQFTMRPSNQFCLLLTTNLYVTSSKPSAIDTIRLQDPEIRLAGTQGTRRQNLASTHLVL
jgi:hypothetical protein